MIKPPVILPPEWEHASGTRTTAINMYILLFIVLVGLGWKVAIGVLCVMLVVDCIGILINKHKYSELKSDFENYLYSGLRPYLVYTTSDFFGINRKLIIDDKISVFLSNVSGEPFVFQPIIVFLSDKTKADFSKKHLASDIEEYKTFYKEHIAKLPLYKPTSKNLALLEEIMLQHDFRSKGAK